MTTKTKLITVILWAIIFLWVILFFSSVAKGDFNEWNDIQEAVEKINKELTPKEKELYEYKLQMEKLDIERQELLSGYNKLSSEVNELYKQKESLGLFTKTQPN